MAVCFWNSVNAKQINSNTTHNSSPVTLPDNTGVVPSKYLSNSYGTVHFYI